MKDFKLLVKNWGFWVVIYAFLTTITVVILSISIANHQCPKPTLPEIDKEYIDKIKEISHANSHDVDSLFLELYGFKPE